MARTVRSQQIQTRSARAKLAQQHDPYWISISRGAHFGYRKGSDGGSWYGRYRKGGKYLTRQLCIADDVRDADGSDVLDFLQAQAAARAWFADLANGGTEGETPKDQYTVSQAIDDYLAWAEGHTKTAHEMRQRANIHILPTFGKAKVDSLATAKIREWHEALATAPARKRGSAAKPVSLREQAASPDEKRARKVTANKQLTLLKAALNHAYRDGKVTSDDAWRKVRPFKNVETSRVEYLSKDECQRLINACAGDFRLLVKAALHTGCRYGELTGLLVGDFNPDAETVHIRESKSGKPRHVALGPEGQPFFRHVTAGRAADSLLFNKDNGTPWRRSEQTRPFNAALKAAKINKPVVFHSLRHTYASHLAMAGVPLYVIAQQLGHSDTRMVERHYGHLAPNYVAKMIRDNLPNLAGKTDTKVSSIRG